MVNVKSDVIGGSFTGNTLMVTVETAVPPSPSLTNTVNTSVPLKFWFGVYVNVPSAFTTDTPFAAWV